MQAHTLGLERRNPRNVFCLLGDQTQDTSSVRSQREAVASGTCTSNCISASWAKASQPRRGKWGAFAFQLFFSNDKAPGGCGLREEGFILVQSLKHSQSIVAGQTCGGGGSFPAGRSTGPWVYYSRSRRCAVGWGHSNRFNVYSFNNLP